MHIMRVAAGAHYEWLLVHIMSGCQVHIMRVAARCATDAVSTTCAVHVEDCEGWWSSGAILAAQVRCPRLDSWRLPASSLFSSLPHNKSSKNL